MLKWSPTFAAFLTSFSVLLCMSLWLCASRDMSSAKSRSPSDAVHVHMIPLLTPMFAPVIIQYIARQNRNGDIHPWVTPVLMNVGHISHLSRILHITSLWCSLSCEEFRNVVKKYTIWTLYGCYRKPFQSLWNLHRLRMWLSFAKIYKYVLRFSIQNWPIGSSSNHYPNPLNTPSDPPTAANRLKLPNNVRCQAACANIGLQVCI